MIGIVGPALHDSKDVPARQPRIRLGMARHTLGQCLEALAGARKVAAREAVHQRHTGQQQ
ncbi:MAG: hypothetical protein U1F25_12580 [Rubrivivax sp.]